jgi:hypothetical protein
MLKKFNLKRTEQRAVVLPPPSLPRTSLLATAFAAGLIATQAFAQDNPPAGPENRIEKLEEAVKQLQRQNAELRNLLTNPVQRATVVVPNPPVVSEASTAKVAPSKSEGDRDVRFFWKDGLNFQSADGKTFKGKIGGRLQYDIASGIEDSFVKSVAGDTPLSAEFRRARLFTSGEINGGVPVHYILQIDFAGGDFKFTDVYLGLREIPFVGTLQLGQMYEPFSLEQNTSDNYVTFLERGAAIEAFSPARNVGAMIINDLFNERMTYSVGVFTDDENDKADGDAFESNVRFTGRVTGLPWYDEASKGRSYLHLGAGGSIINPENDTVRYRARPTRRPSSPSARFLCKANTSRPGWIRTLPPARPSTAFIFSHPGS